MKLILTIISALLSCVLLVGGFRLWMRRDERRDYSRYVLAVFSWFTSLPAFLFIFRSMTANIIVYKPYLDPEHTFVPILMQLTFFFYPLTVMQPIAKPVKTCALLFAPPIVIFLVGVCSGIEYTSLETYSDLWQNIAKPDVLFRLFAQVVMLAYSFALFFVKYDWRKSSADRNFILKYSLGFCCIGLLLFCGLITHISIFPLLHQIVFSVFCFWIVWYELSERLPAPADGVTVVERVSSDVVDKVWIGITRLMVEQQCWRNPELSLQSLSEELASNRTYVSEAFKKHAGCTFSEYIVKLRIEFVVSELKRNPQSNLQRLFSQAGYRQRTTAYRNFQKITGVSPTEFIENLK